MVDYYREFPSETLFREPLAAHRDGESVLGSFVATLSNSPGTALKRSLIRRSGRLVYGRIFQPMMDLMKEAFERGAAAGSTHPHTMVTEAIRHARFALMHSALARGVLLVIVLICLLLGVVILAHETRNTESVYQIYIAHPDLARSPQQSWGYTPVLHDLPEETKARLIAFDRYIESGFASLGFGPSESASRSVNSQKLGAALLSLFGLIPLARFGLSQDRKSEVSRERAVEAISSV